MPSQPKRPLLPAPDPNWELELHPERAASRKPSPDSRDEMLAHALLRAEPEPFAAPDEFGDPESRRTLPPPVSMTDHVARMMAEAAAFDEPALGLEGDERDTMEVHIPPPDLTAAFGAASRPVSAPLSSPSQRQTKPDPHVGLRLTRSDPSPSLADLSDMSDLPAVFSVEAWSVDEPAISPALPPLNDPMISPLPAAPMSDPPISAPFASLDPLELTAELEEVRAKSIPPASQAAPSGGAMRAPSDKVAAIEARFAAGDYARALVLAESTLVAHPGDAAVARYAESCRDQLYERYIEKLGAVDHVPRLLIPRSAVTGLALDHRAGFLLSCVDGGSTVEEIIDVSAMPRLEAVRLLYELVQEGVIEMASPR